MSKLVMHKLTAKAFPQDNNGSIKYVSGGAHKIIFCLLNRHRLEASSHAEFSISRGIHFLGLYAIVTYQHFNNCIKFAHIFADYALAAIYLPTLNMRHHS